MLNLSTDVSRKLRKINKNHTLNLMTAECFFFYEHCVRRIVALINLERKLKSFETRRGKSNMSWIIVIVYEEKDKLAY